MAQVKEKWVSGLSDCCSAGLKEIGQGVTILVCADCGQMCNRQFDMEDYDEYEDSDQDEDDE